VKTPPRHPEKSPVCRCGRDSGRSSIRQVGQALAATRMVSVGDTDRLVRLTAPSSCSSSTYSTTPFIRCRPVHPCPFPFDLRQAFQRAVPHDLWSDRMFIVPEDHEATRRIRCRDLVVASGFTGHDKPGAARQSSPGTCAVVSHRSSACPPGLVSGFFLHLGCHRQLPPGGPGPGIGLSATLGGVFQIAA
jgi:hypothetical protein